MGLFLGIDLGAGSLKASVVQLDGRSVACASSPIRSLSAFLGASEQDPNDWWRALCMAVQTVLQHKEVNAGRIAAIAISAGAHSAVLADREGAPLRPAIMWNDQRSRDQVERLRAEYGTRISEISCNSITPTWTLAHLQWLREQQPHILDAAERLYPAKDWLRSRLTGDWVTEPVDAAGLMLYDPVKGAWSEELARLSGLPMSVLPPVVPSTSVAGVVSSQAAALTGLVPGTPVIAGVSDTAAEALGVGMVSSGVGVVKLATAATLSCIATNPEPSRVLVTYPYVPAADWFWITGTNSCASAHAWLRDTMFTDGRGNSADFDAMEALAVDVPAGADGLFFHPYLNGERAPYWDATLRADFVGLTFHHGPGHLLRAFYEGVAFSLADCMRQFHDAGVQMPRLRLTGGGSRSPMWRQILADVLDAQIELPENADASFGCALVAALGVGAFSSVGEMAGAVRLSAVHQPDKGRSDFYREAFAIYRDIQAALAPINRRIGTAQHRGRLVGH